MKFRESTKWRIMVPTNLLFLLLCSFIIVSKAADVKKCPTSSDPFPAAQIIPIILPYEYVTLQKQIGLYYYIPQFQIGDKIVLTRGENNQSTVIITEYYIKKNKGLIHTEIAPIPLPRHYSKYIPQSKGYCAYWERNKIQSEKFCLKTNPTWMNDMKKIIGNQNLSSIIIPGTHQSGSYSKIFPQSLINKYSSTQDIDVLEQLIHGVRYLDLKVEYYREDYYIKHGPLRLKPLAIILQHIKQFVDNTQEIVIVSFRESNKGFGNADHHNFANYLYDELYEHLLPTPADLWNIKLQKIWESGKRLIITHDNSIYSNRPYVWPKIHEHRQYTLPNHSMNRFLNEAEASSIIPKVTTAAFTILETREGYETPDMLYPASTPSLRSLGIAIGFNITQVYNEYYFRKMQIIAVDYIEFTGIVDVAIEWNKRKSSPCYSQYALLMP